MGFLAGSALSQVMSPVRDRAHINTDASLAVPTNRGTHISEESDVVSDKSKWVRDQDLRNQGLGYSSKAIDPGHLKATKYALTPILFENGWLTSRAKRTRTPGMRNCLESKRRWSAGLVANTRVSPVETEDTLSNTSTAKRAEAHISRENTTNIQEHIRLIMSGNNPPSPPKGPKGPTPPNTPKPPPQIAGFKKHDSPRAETEFHEGVRVTVLQRSSMDPKDLEKLRVKATACLVTGTYKYAKQTDGQKALKDSYSLETQNKACEKQVNAYELGQPFQIITSYAGNGKYPGGDFVNIFDDPEGVSIAQVRKSNLTYRTFWDGDTVKQDLDWTHDLILSSCDKDLQSTISERLYNIPDKEQGGPLTYKILQDVLSKMGAEAIEIIVKVLRDLKLSCDLFQQEDVHEAVKIIRGTFNRLAAAKAVPHDKYNIVCKIFQTSSTDKFNERFRMLEHLSEMGTTVVANTVDILYETAEEMYDNLCATGKWAASSNQRAGPHAFATDVTGAPRPEGAGTPPAGAPPPAPRSPFKIPPKEGEPHAKKITRKDGTVQDVLWCGKCKRWTSHTTEQHLPKAELLALRERENQSKTGDDSGKEKQDGDGTGTPGNPSGPGGYLCAPAAATGETPSDEVFKARGYEAVALAAQLMKCSGDR